MKETTLKAAMSEMGRRGGLAGDRQKKSAAAKLRMAQLSRAQRSALAQKAGFASAKARWGWKP